MDRDRIERAEDRGKGGEKSKGGNTVILKHHHIFPHHIVLELIG